MIFMIGVMLQVAALVILVVFLKKMNLPKAEAYITEITLDYYEKDQQQLKKHPHGLINYVYESIDYKAKIHLLKRNMQVGDQIMVSFKAENPEKPKMYAPRQEIIAAIVVSAIGFILIGVSVFVMDYFDLW